MSKSTSSIEINGRRYDAQTGQTVAGKVIKPRPNNIDGIRGKQPAQTVVLAAARLQPPQPIVALSTAKLMDMKAPKRPARSIAQKASGHTPQSSQTLMRHVVQKPTKSIKRQHPAQSHLGSLVAQPAVAVTAKTSVSKVPSERLNRALQATKSAKISRFARSYADVVAASPTALPKLVQFSSKNNDNQRTNDIFEQALERATSHLQAPVKHFKHPKKQRFLSQRRLSISATALLVILLVGFIGVENRANLALRLAATKAGFSASMPGYKPAGFSVGRLQYSAGNVAINYHSNSDNRAFAITEKPSAWDSTTLRDNFVSTADNQFQTVSVAGRTIYLYGKNNAAWVNGGIMYQVKTDGVLSGKQLSEIAASL